MPTTFKSALTLLALGAGALFAHAAPAAADSAPGAGYTVAIFTANRAGPVGDNELGALEDYVTARITDLNMHVISGETALNSVAGMQPEAKANALDAQLAQGTSAVRLAQTLGATHLLQVTISGFDSNKRNLDAYGVKAVNEERVVRVTYKILDGTTGASLAADTIKVSKVYQQTDAANEARARTLNDLLDDAAQKVAASLKRQIDRGRIATTAAAQGQVTITLTTELTDVYVPDVRIGAENTISISESKFKVTALAATVEVDGLAVGTAPGALEVRPGLHKLRVVREGFKPWERTVNFAHGQTLNVGLEMTEAGFARWQEATGFLNELKNGAKLTDGLVKALEGKAKMLESSGYKVNTTQGVTVKTDGLRSLFGL